MEILRTTIENEKEEVIYRIEGVLIPCVRGEVVYVGGKEYSIWRVTTHVRNVSEKTTVVDRTLWV